ncbi:hypothetical protein IscW_ISCW006630, partial [Ixodes scapularis]
QLATCAPSYPMPGRAVKKRRDSTLTQRLAGVSDLCTAGAEVTTTNSYPCPNVRNVAFG